MRVFPLWFFLLYLKFGTREDKDRVLLRVANLVVGWSLAMLFRRVWRLWGYADFAGLALWCALSVTPLCHALLVAC